MAQGHTLPHRARAHEEPLQLQGPPEAAGLGYYGRRVPSHKDTVTLRGSLPVSVSPTALRGQSLRAGPMLSPPALVAAITSAEAVSVPGGGTRPQDD